MTSFLCRSCRGHISRYPCCHCYDSGTLAAEAVLPPAAPPRNFFFAGTAFAGFGK